MEIRLTNNYSEYIREVEQELLSPFSKDSLLLYAMFPELGNEHFSIQLIEAPQPYVLLRRWAQDISENIKLGIYQLHNISIDEHKINVPIADYWDIHSSLSENRIEIAPLKSIILDGANYHLIIFRQKPGKFQWRDNAQIGAETRDLVRRMVRLVNNDKG